MPPEPQAPPWELVALPLTQQWPLATETPQAPQLVQLLKVLVHVPLQQTCPAEQHEPPQAEFPPGQAHDADQLTVAFA